LGEFTGGVRTNMGNIHIFSGREWVTKRSGNQLNVFVLLLQAEKYFLHLRIIIQRLRGIRKRVVLSFNDYDFNVLAGAENDKFLQTFGIKSDPGILKGMGKLFNVLQ
jgi:hypothetical protein